MTTFAFAGSPAPTAAGNLVVPDVRGMDRSNAEALIGQAGFKAVVNVVESKLPDLNGKVYLQDPTPPALRAENSIVTLHVVQVPATPTDVKQRFDNVDKALEKLETDDSAKTRYEKVIEKLDEILTSGSSGSGAKGVRSSTQS